MRSWLRAKFLMMRGDHFLRQKRYETALPYYREVTVKQPDNAFAFYKTGYCLAALNRYQDAVAAYDRAFQIRPDYYAVHANLSQALEKLGQVRAASEYMERAFRNDPLRNDPKRAAVREGLEALRRAATLRPDHADTRYAIGVALAAQGDYGGAIAAYKEAIRLHPGFADAYYNLGVAYSELRQSEKEIEAYQTAIQFNEKDVKAWGNLALTYSGKQMHKEALEAYAKLCELQPENEMGYYGAASSLAFLDRYDEAVPNYKRAIEIDPTFIAAHEYLGYTYSLMERFSEALACYEGAMKLAPGSAQLHSELAEMYERMGDKEGAQRLRSQGRGIEAERNRSCHT